ncbi:MAG: phosphatase PAP2-related protein [Chitinophagales bacterium]
MIRLFFANMITTWKSLWASKHFRMQFLLTFLLFASVIYFSSLYLSILEVRRGTVLLDPFLNRLPPKEYSLPIFCIVHSSLLISLILILLHPKAFLKALQGVSLLLILRTLTVYAVPLEPPIGMIYLQDPITGFFLNNVNVVTKDLFFSGHVSVMCLLIYFSPDRYWRIYLTFVTPVLALLIMWQHVHYSVDVIAAPFFALFCGKVIDKLNERWAFGVDNIELSRVNN